MITKKIVLLFVLIVALLLLPGCSAESITSTPSVTHEPTSVANILPSDTPIPLPTETQIPVPILPAQTPEPFSLAERGPYWIGRRSYTLVDESRGGREIQLVVRYPAIKQGDSAGNFITKDALPDMSAAPYPLILTGLNSGSYLFQSHLVSHGFVMVTILNLESYLILGFDVVDHPLDLLFTLDQIGNNQLPELDGLINSEMVGVAGYSSDGEYSLAVSGARIDPEFYLSKCGQLDLREIEKSEIMVRGSCTLALDWDQFVAHVGEKITSSDDGLWQPLTDERIRAVMPMAPCSTWFYGDRGIGSVDRPTFIIAGTEDASCSYNANVKYIFENLTLDDKFMVSFIGKEHMMVTENETIDRIRHFATAFFGYYLQGRQDYAYYFSEEFVSQYADLAWGIYSGD